MIEMQSPGNCVITLHAVELLQSGGGACFEGRRVEVLPNVRFRLLALSRRMDTEAAQHAGGTDTALAALSIHRRVAVVLPARPGFQPFLRCRRLEECREGFPFGGPHARKLEADLVPEQRFEEHLHPTHKKGMIAVVAVRVPYRHKRGTERTLSALGYNDRFRLRQVRG